MTDKGKHPDPRSQQHAGTVATENPGAAEEGERHEVGDAESSRRDPPHVTANDEAAPVQAAEGAEAPVLPANAAGRDALSAEEQDFDVDEETAYDRSRPRIRIGRPAGGDSFTAKYVKGAKNGLHRGSTQRRRHSPRRR